MSFACIFNKSGDHGSCRYVGLANKIFHKLSAVSFR